METKKVKRVDEVTFAKSIRLMFKNIKSDKTIYLAFTKRGFHTLVFVMGMSVIANIVLVDLLLRAPTMVQRMDTPIFVIQFSLSAGAIVSGFWLFLRGVNIITDK